MNKKSLSEQDIRTKYITPAIIAAGWDSDLQLREEVSFTKGKLEFSLIHNDILLIRSNGSATLVGNIAIVDDINDNICYAGYLMRLRTFNQSLNSYYLKYVFKSKYLRNLIEIPIRTTTGVKNINSTEVSNLIIPLPPLAEQQRIIEKVDKLMALCDELEHEVSNAKKYASQLMEVVLQEAFTNTKNEEKASKNITVEHNIQKTAECKWAAAARGKIKQSTMDSIIKRATEVANEENLWTGSVSDK